MKNMEYVENYNEQEKIRQEQKFSEELDKKQNLIEEKQNKNIELSKDELTFIYHNFGNSSCRNIISKRNKRKDLVSIWGVKEDEVALSRKEWIENIGKIKVFYGNLDLNCLTCVEGFKMPEIIYGNLDLNYLRSANGLDLSKRKIYGNVNLKFLEKGEGANLSEAEISGRLDLSYLQDANGLNLHETKIYNGLCCFWLENGEGLDLSDTVIREFIDLRNLTNAKGLKLPKFIDYLYLNRLENAEGLMLPLSAKYINLSSLTSAEGLRFPLSVEKIDLYGLESTEGLKVPAYIVQHLNRPKGIPLTCVKSDKLELLKEIKGILMEYGEECFRKMGISCDEIDEAINILENRKI